MAHLHDDESVPHLRATAAVMHESTWVLCVDTCGHLLWLHGRTAREVVDLPALRRVGDFRSGSVRVLGDPLAAFLALLARRG